MKPQKPFICYGFHFGMLFLQCCKSANTGQNRLPDLHKPLPSVKIPSKVCHINIAKNRKKKNHNLALKNKNISFKSLNWVPDSWFLKTAPAVRRAQANDTHERHPSGRMRDRKMRLGEVRARSLTGERRQRTSRRGGEGRWWRGVRRVADHLAGARRCGCGNCIGGLCYLGDGQGFVRVSTSPGTP